MAVVLSSNNTNNSKVDLQTTTSTKLMHSKRVKRDLDRIYVEAETKARSGFIGMKYIDLYGFPIDTNQLVFLSKENAQRLKMGVFSIRNRELYLATPDPGYLGQREFIEKVKSEGWKPYVYLCSEISFDKLLQTYNYVVEIRRVVDEIRLSDELLEEASTKEFTLEELSTKIRSVSLSELIETVLASALGSRASDIHFEPEKETYNIRLRIDGVLYTVAQLPVSMLKQVQSRLKIISGVKLNVENVPQDGRFSFKAGEKEIDVRVSMLPSNYGYSVVLRLLGTGQVALELEALGFIGLAKKRVWDAIHKPQGMILNTGPTGSGKTTTLYTFLKYLNDGESKIITLEDPIEYKLEGISQTQIDSKAGYTFGSGLKSILRQDPDIIMVGEIRDNETSEVAVQASLTGHLVLSTVHTNDAAGAIPRLMELDVKGFLLADSLSAVIGQRLVRRLCQNCKIETQLSPEHQAIVADQLRKIPSNAEIKLPNPLKFYTSKGCEKCSGLGFKGRVGVYEVMTITTGMRNLLNEEHISIMQAREIASQEGMITMLQDGIIKSLMGTTSVPEVLENVTY